jgi:hypothetical protein
VGKVVVTVSWDGEGVIVDVRMQDKADRTQESFRQVQPHKNPTEIVFQHDNARPHTSLKTLKAITKDV